MVRISNVGNKDVTTKYLLVNFHNKLTINILFFWSTALVIDIQVFHC